MMTPEEQRIALAEWAGWTDVAMYHPPSEVHVDNDIFTPKPFLRGHKTKDGLWMQPPDYAHDLNAVHELEKRLTYEQQGDYCMKLPGAIHSNPTMMMFSARHSTAAVCCEALCRVLFPERFK